MRRERPRRPRCRQPAVHGRQHAQGRDRLGGAGTPPRHVDRSTYALLSDTIVNSSNEGANAVLARVGGGSTSRGTARVNRLVRAAGLSQTSLDGPYRTGSSPGSGPSRKFTSADDLRRLAALIYRAAATGDGALAGPAWDATTRACYSG